MVANRGKCLNRGLICGKFVLTLQAELNVEIFLHYFSSFFHGKHDFIKRDSTRNDPLRDPLHLGVKSGE